ncbi:hypothetical protein Aduo_000795 [Ancylostoma duodenale]
MVKRTIRDGAFHRFMNQSCGSPNTRKKRKKKNKEKNVTDAEGIGKKKSKRGNVNNASKTTGSVEGYHCPGCSVLVQDQEGLNTHCVTKHGRNRFAPENVTFASEDEFYEWKAKLEQEQHTCFNLVENHDSVLTKYFCCPSVKLPLRSGKSRLCTFFIKATFSAVVTVRYCIFHFGHHPLIQVTAPESTDMIPYPQPISLTIPEVASPRQVDHSLKAPLPSYIVLDGNADREAVNFDQIASVPAQKNLGNIRSYRCPQCGFRVHDQLEMNAHCTSQHGKRYEVKSETFATENDFCQWKEKLEKEQNTCWRLEKTHYYGNVVTKYFFCSSSKVPPSKGKPMLCSSFLKATFCGEVAVQYCALHVGRDPLEESLDSTDKAVSCQQPLTLTTPENLDPGQADLSSELHSPSYTVVNKKTEEEVSSDHNSPGPSVTENVKQSVPIKKEVDIPIVLPSPPPPSNQTRNASFTTEARFHVQETQDNWAEILNTALSDPLLSTQYKVLLQCLVASNRDLKNVIAMMKSKQG